MLWLQVPAILQPLNYTHDLIPSHSLKWHIFSLPPSPPSFHISFSLSHCPPPHARAKPILQCPPKLFPVPSAQLYEGVQSRTVSPAGNPGQGRTSARESLLQQRTLSTEWPAIFTISCSLCNLISGTQTLLKLSPDLLSYIGVEKSTVCHWNLLAFQFDLQCITYKV